MPPRRPLLLEMNGAYPAPIVPETREHTAVRVRTQQDENPMSTKLCPIAGYG